MTITTVYSEAAHAEANDINHWMDFLLGLDVKDAKGWKQFAGWCARHNKQGTASTTYGMHDVDYDEAKATDEAWEAAKAHAIVTGSVSCTYTIETPNGDGTYSEISATYRRPKAQLTAVVDDQSLYCQFCEAFYTVTPHDPECPLAD